MSATTADAVDDAAILRQMDLADRIVARDVRDGATYQLWSRDQQELDRLNPSWDAVFQFDSAGELTHLQSLVRRLKYRADEIEVGLLA